MRIEEKLQMQKKLRYILRETAFNFYVLNNVVRRQRTGEDSACQSAVYNIPKMYYDNNSLASL